MQLRRLALLGAFYNSYRILPTFISLVCCVLYWYSGLMALQVISKLITDAGILFFMVMLNSNKLYYYHNLHISRFALLAGFFVIDMFIFSLCLCITTLLV
jgi:hypothetical protein